MAIIEPRGAYQFRARVRRNGKDISKTFENRKAAEEWARVMEGQVTGGSVVDRRVVKRTSLADACAWMLAGQISNTPNAKNLRAKLAYWEGSEFANWSLDAIHDWSLIEWRRRILDEDAEDPEPECGPQTVIHRLNALSKLFQTWARANQVALENPVNPGVRPGQPDGRNRRLREGEERRLINAARKSSRPWLRPAIVIAIETAMRQSELAELAWDRVMLTGHHPHIDLLKTKNDRPR